MIGGERVEVEIDESCLGKTKYGRGLPKQHIWIFGGIERKENGRAFAKVVENRTKETLVKAIQTNILPGTIIFSDEWAAYNDLASLGYTHHKICHKKQFSRFVF